MYFVKCNLCGFRYDNNSSFDRKAHLKRCRAVEKVRRKFGFWVTGSYEERERIKQAAWITLDDDKADLYEKLAAAKKILQCWFSRSLAETDWSLKHPDFTKWAANFLRTEHNIFPGEIMDHLIRAYRIKGIKKRARSG